jgi:hypothetical protein
MCGRVGQRQLVHYGQPETEAYMNSTSESRKPNQKLTFRSSPKLIVALAAGAALIQSLSASENVPHRPFAQWADLPAQGQFVVGLVYQESEAYHIWTGHEQQNITWHEGGEKYGVDYNQGYVTLQYGITPKWAVDLSVGATTVGWRTFENGDTQSTVGLMDTSLGVRYQVFNEADAQSPWIPTLTLRVGGILPGTFDEEIAFAPGTRSAGIEPEVLLRKHFGWTGFGAYADALFRWNRTTANDQYITAIGLFQQIKGWELDAGYRHLQTITGSDIVLHADNTIDYPRDVREISDSIEAGFSYTTPKRHIRYGFQTRVVFDGSNTSRDFWLGGSVEMPFGGK